jgi:cytochrome P450
MALWQWAFTSLFCVSLVHSLYRRALAVFRRRKFIQRNCCKPPNRYRHKEPILGLDLSLDTYQNLKNGNYLEGYRGHFKTHGNTFEAKVLGAKAIFTVEPENIRTVLSTKFEDFDDDSQRRNAWASVLGHSIFTTERAGWSESRRLLRPIFAKSQINNLELIERHVQSLLHEIHQGDPVVDLRRLFYRLTFKIATDLFFGDPDVSTLSDKSLSHLTDAFGHALEVMGRRHVLGNGLDAFIPDAHFKNDHEDILRVIDRYVDKALKAKKDRDSDDSSVKADDTEKTGSESRYVFCEEIASATTNSDQIRGELLSPLFAGRDTTAILLGNLCFILARNPHIWERLQLEISHLGGIPPTLERLKAFAYLRNCLHECEYDLLHETGRRANF